MVTRFFSKDRRTDRNSSVVQTVKELTDTEYLSRDSNSDDIDVLAKMHEGTELLKLCSRRTRSHWRTFLLDEDNEFISWHSHKKDAVDTTIHISNIVEIVCHNASVVSKFMDTLPDELMETKDLQRQQFTIRYELDNNKQPSISPNVSLTNRELSPKDPSLISPTTRSDHHSKTSLSFIRAVASVSTVQNSLRNKDTKYLEDSVTESGSSSSKKRQRRERSGSRSFFKNLLKSNDKSSELEPAPTPDGLHAHSRNVTADSMNLSRNVTFARDAVVEYKGKHVHELHVMAKCPEITMMWVYGLAQLIDIHQNAKVFNPALFRTTTKELLRYAEDLEISNVYDRMTMRIRRHLDDKDIPEFRVLKERKRRVTEGLDHIIDQLPEPEHKLLFEDKEIDPDTSMHYLLRKIRQDQEHLKVILGVEEFAEVHSTKDIKANIKRWAFLLTRIEINIGGYQIALNNQKTMHKRNITHYSYANFVPPTWNQSRSETLGDRLGHNSHKGYRARRQTNHSPKHQALNMLKNRSRSPRSTNVQLIDAVSGDTVSGNALHLPPTPHNFTKAVST